MKDIIKMDYPSIREADFILIDKDIYEKLIPVKWKDLDKWVKQHKK